MNRASVIIVLSFLATALSFSTFAQESGFPTEEERPAEGQYQPEEEWAPKEGGMILTEERNVINRENKTESATVPANQTKKTTTRPAAKANTSSDRTQKPAVNVQENEDSVLSYNFLYYLIQKFKFDTVE